MNKTQLLERAVNVMSHACQELETEHKLEGVAFLFSGEKHESVPLELLNLLDSIGPLKDAFQHTHTDAAIVASVATMFDNLQHKKFRAVVVGAAMPGECFALCTRFEMKDGHLEWGERFRIEGEQIENNLLSQWFTEEEKKDVN